VTANTPREILVDLTDLPAITNEVYYPLYWNESRYLIAFGGAGSGKSVFAAEKVIVRILTEQNHKFLIIRKVARTIRHSVFALFVDMISLFGLTPFAEINKSEMTITFPAFNSTLIFMGVDDQEKLKSIAGITGVWIEEGTELTPSDFEQIDLRLRGITPNYKQILITFNPISILHWIKGRFFDSGDDEILNKTTIVKTTYKHNRFIDDEYKQKLESIKDPVTRSVYCDGDWGVLGNLVFTNWIAAEIPDPERFSTYQAGLDFGFSIDPTVFIRVAVKDGVIYCIDEFYEHGLTNDRIAARLKDRIKGHSVYCDSAEPKSIEELKRHGVNARPVVKGRDSKHYGIQLLKQYQIVIDPRRCPRLLAEIQGYVHKQDKNGRNLPDPIDYDDHCIDALRYAMNSYMKRRGLSIPKISASQFGL
jgi:phage terminase large subunit